jgi:hypothetical protein
MPNPRRFLVTVLASAVGAMVAPGCDRAGDAPRTDSVAAVAPVTPPVGSARPVVSSGWDPDAGPVLLAATERPDAAITVFPEVQGEQAAAELQLDTALVRKSAAMLVDRAGAAAAATLGDRTAPGEDEDCVGWPMFKVVRPGGVTTPWAVGFIGARLVPIPLDSVGSLSAADSAALVAEIARLASTLPARDDAARLRGLPFVAQDVRRFRAAPGVDALVAQVIRRVHQEANPLEERTLVIAERVTTGRDSARLREQPPGRYTLAFHERTVGREETLEGTEVLAAFTTRGAPRPMLVLARESEEGIRYAIIERAGPRSWRVKWTSALVRC